MRRRSSTSRAATAQKVRAACEAGTVNATVKADIRIRLEQDGGYGYNVVGKIPGRVNPNQMVLVSAHHDAHFRGALDDTSAVATALTMAKAMKMSRTRPAKTMQFLITTGEEAGNTNSWYDWLLGANHAITKAHPNWVGRIAAQINLEWQGAKNAPLQVRSNPDIAPYVQSVLDANSAYLPYGVDNDGLVRRNVWTWNDQWPFTAAGVPSVYFVTKDTTYRGAWYHSQYDTMALIDWSYIGKNAKLYRQVHMGFDTGLVPYDFEARAEQFDNWTADDRTALVAAGLSQSRVDWLYAQFDRFLGASQDFKLMKGAIHSGQYSLVNTRLMEAERIINSSLTALDQWEGTTYPHIQPLDDVAELNATIADLEASPVDPDQAQADLYDVGPFWYGDSFGRAVYERQLQRQRPDYYRINWAGLGHLERYPNIYTAYQQIGAGDYATAHDSLVEKRDSLLADLDEAVLGEGQAFAAAAQVIEDVTPLMSHVR